MRDDDVLPVSTPTSSSSTSFVPSSSSRKDGSSESSASGRGRYKYWAFAVILMLAFWSMLTGTVSLRWSAGDLDESFTQDYHSPSADDLDVLVTSLSLHSHLTFSYAIKPFFLFVHQLINLSVKAGPLNRVSSSNVLA